MPLKLPRAIMVTIFIHVLCNPLMPKTIALFSPEGQPQLELLKLLNSAQHRIYAAIYSLTDKKIADALLQAHQRGVSVELVTEKNTLSYKHSKISYLANKGLKIYLFNNKNENALMHHKFAIIDNTIWTGSFNWTVSASQKNRENILIIHKKRILNQYLIEFNQLKKDAVHINRESYVNFQNPEKNQPFQLNKQMQIKKILKNKIINLIKVIREKMKIKQVTYNS